ncbi:MAG: hypothetical protein ACK55I_03530, partial [bacterium]
MGAVGQRRGEAHHLPDEGGQLAREGDLHFLPRLAVGGELAPSLVQPVLAAPGEFLHCAAMGFGDGFLPGREFLADLGRQSVVLRAFVEDPAQV